MELGISKGISCRTNVPKARESGQRGLLVKEVVLVIFVQLQELFTNVITALLYFYSTSFLKFDGPGSVIWI